MPSTSFLKQMAPPFCPKTKSSSQKWPIHTLGSLFARISSGLHPISLHHWTDSVVFELFVPDSVSFGNIVVILPSVCLLLVKPHCGLVHWHAFSFPVWRIYGPLWVQKSTKHSNTKGWTPPRFSPSRHLLKFQVPRNTFKYPYVTGFKANFSTHSAIPAGFRFVPDPVLWFILCQTFQARICLFFRTSNDIKTYFTSLSIKRVMVCPPTVQNSRITQGAANTTTHSPASLVSQCFTLCTFRPVFLKKKERAWT